MRWGFVTGAEKVEIDNQIGSVATPGSATASPQTTTTYTLTATCGLKVRTKQVTITVISPPTPEPTATPARSMSLNLAEVRSQLFSRTNFRLSLFTTIADAGFSVIVLPPKDNQFSEDFYFTLYKQGKVQFRWLKLGNWEQIAIGATPEKWIEKKDLPPELRGPVQEMLDQTWNLYKTTLSTIFPNREAKFVGTDSRGVEEYATSDLHVFIDPDSGLPLLVMAQTSVFTVRIAGVDSRRDYELAVLFVLLCPPTWPEEGGCQ